MCTTPGTHTHTHTHRIMRHQCPGGNHFFFGHAVFLVSLYAGCVATLHVSLSLSVSVTTTGERCEFDPHTVTTHHVSFSKAPMSRASDCSLPPSMCAPHHTPQMGPACTQTGIVLVWCVGVSRVPWREHAQVHHPLPQEEKTTTTHTHRATTERGAHPPLPLM